MKNILSSLNESEKKRILDMHKSSTKNNYLFENEKTILLEQIQQVDAACKAITELAKANAVTIAGAKMKVFPKVTIGYSPLDYKPYANLIQGKGGFQKGYDQKTNSYITSGDWIIDPRSNKNWKIPTSIWMSWDKTTFPTTEQDNIVKDFMHVRCDTNIFGIFASNWTGYGDTASGLKEAINKNLSRYYTPESLFLGVKGATASRPLTDTSKFNQSVNTLVDTLATIQYVVYSKKDEKKTPVIIGAFKKG
jgi:hypothetical protein